MSSDVVAVILGIVNLIITGAMFVGLLFPSIYIRDNVSNRRWIIFGIWFACLMLMVGYYELTLKLLRTIPSFIVVIHLMITGFAIFSFLLPKKSPLKLLSRHFENRWVSLSSCLGLDVCCVLVGFALIFFGVKPTEGASNDKWVDERIAELNSDSKKLDEIALIEIIDTATIKYLKALNAKIDSLGTPHLHSRFDSTFYYKDKRIVPISKSNIEKASAVKKGVQEKFKLPYLQQIRKKHKERIYYMNQGDVLVFEDKSFEYSYDRDRIVRDVSEEVRLLGYNKILFKWGEEADEMKEVSVK